MKNCVLDEINLTLLGKKSKKMERQQHMSGKKSNFTVPNHWGGSALSIVILLDKQFSLTGKKLPSYCRKTRLQTMLNKLTPFSSEFFKLMYL